MTLDRQGGLRPEGIVRRLAPALGVMVVAAALIFLPAEASDPRALAVAVLGTLLVFAAGAVLPWSRFPAWAEAAVPMGALLLVPVFRESDGGSESVFGWLAFGPILWLALYGTRRQLALGVAGVALVFVVPVVAIGAPDYPLTELRHAVLAVVLCAANGFLLHGLVGESTRQAERARQKAEALRLSQESIVTVARELTSGPDARAQVCKAAISIARADFAVLREPDEHGQFVSTASTGIDLPPNPTDLSEEPSGPGVALATGRRVFLADVQSDPLASRRLAESTGAASVLSEPVLLGGRAIGVLVIGWLDPVDDLDDLPLSTLELLAAEAAVAIERERMQAELRAAARTDALTGLGNRRVWDEELSRELARAGRYEQPVAVAVLDLDRFKDFNDDHGHQAGDRLLQDIAASWSEQLRDVDLFVRYGGEEFAVLLPNSTLEEAREAIERVRQATPRRQTCSAGVAAWDGVEDADSLFDRADRALYRAKREGRDRTTVDHSRDFA